MLIFETKHALKAHLQSIKSEKKQIGFVPTMGALHLGHVSLIKESKNKDLYTVCSIFVNPTQFNDPKDLENYPRTPENDTDLLIEAGCDVLFMPNVEEMYPKTDNRNFEFGHLDRILEGGFRPGHFLGVAKIVSLLFESVMPNFAFFGSKDYQQVMVITQLVNQLKLPIKIVPCPIIREADGLAMSSRNTRLTAEERKAATRIPQILISLKALKREGKTIAEIKEFVKNEAAKEPLFKLDYFEICNPQNLTILDFLPTNQNAIALIACFVGRVRLIDNMPI